MVNGQTPDQQLDTITRNVGGRSEVLEQWKRDVATQHSNPVVLARFHALADEMQELLREHRIDLPGLKPAVEEPLNNADFRFVILLEVQRLLEQGGRLAWAVRKISTPPSWVDRGSLSPVVISLLGMTCQEVDADTPQDEQERGEWNGELEVPTFSKEAKALQLPPMNEVKAASSFNPGFQVGQVLLMNSTYDTSRVSFRGPANSTSSVVLLNGLPITVFNGHLSEIPSHELVEENTNG